MKILEYIATIVDSDIYAYRNALLDLETGKVTVIGKIEEEIESPTIITRIGGLTISYVVENGFISEADLQQARAIVDNVSNKFEEAKLAYEIALKEYRAIKRAEFLERVLAIIKTINNELYEAIEEFVAVEAYPQTDIFIYDGYRTWCDSIIFKNIDGDEKAIICSKDTDFDSDTISVCNSSIFFETEEEIYDDEYNWLRDIPYDVHILETVEKVR